MLIQPTVLTPRASTSPTAEPDASTATDVEAGVSGKQIARSVASLTRSVHDLQGVLALAASKLPADDPIANRIDAASANLTRLARAVLDHAALRRP